MPTFKELKDRVELLIDDSKMSSTSAGSFINQGVSEIAGGMKSDNLDVITPPLPDLFTIDTVTTSVTDAFVSMPSTYQRNLQLVVSARGSEIDIAHSFIEFTETYPALNKVGNISEVVEQGGKLYYQGIPSVAEILTLHFFRKPVIMVADEDKPDGIPEHLQIALLTNFAAWKGWDLIDDGIGENAVNALKFKGFFMDALKVLELTIPFDSRSLFQR